MKTVRAKFQCTSITEDQYGNKTAKMMAVYGSEGENADFTKATPSGSLEIQISGDVPAADFFKPGDKFYLDFSKAD